MFKYLVILNLFVMAVVTQDMPPPDLTIPSTTAEPTTPETVITTSEAKTTATTEAITTTTEAATTTTSEATTTTEKVSTAPESTTAATTTTTAPTTTTIHNDIQPATDSPFKTTTTKAHNYPFYPSYPDFYGQRCYYKKQYGYPQARWSCHGGLQYFYPAECFKCCRFEFSNFAGCHRVQGSHCGSLNNRHHGFYK